ncbi:hypothetical protein [Nonomuraea typhae]|uniref:hypothetical protein n=1 Tax=Nonomuraea typhae TaxID=2603600 RepID=UPI0012FC472F|nr:hypothetical protein [Nonomuraea typhae]
MQGGDISNQTTPRLLIEFENLIGHPPARKGLAAVKRTLGQWHRLALEWDLDDLVVKVMWDLSWRLHQTLEVITTQGPDFATALEERLDAEQVPASRVWAYQPRVLARRLASMPYVAAVYTTDPHHALLYGSRGRLITTDNLLQMGRF